MSYIHLLGQVNDTMAMINLYKNAHCLLFPSYYEASPLPPIEAMACGCPVICSDNHALRERCGTAALYCNPDDINYMASLVLSLYQDKTLRDTYIQKGLEHSQNFTWIECAKKTVSTLISHFE
jgi:glycosyltransferase involved in cell wall biosynthesis